MLIVECHQILKVDKFSSFLLRSIPNLFKRSRILINGWFPVDNLQVRYGTEMSFGGFVPGSTNATTLETITNGEMGENGQECVDVMGHCVCEVHGQHLRNDNRKKTVQLD